MGNQGKYFGLLFENYKRSSNYHFHGETCALFLRKNGLGHILGDFSQTHQVTLWTTDREGAVVEIPMSVADEGAGNGAEPLLEGFVDEDWRHLKPGANPSTFEFTTTTPPLFFYSIAFFQSGIIYFCH
jgi:hypothetical protein